MAGRRRPEAMVSTRILKPTPDRRGLTASIQSRRTRNRPLSGVGDAQAEHQGDQGGAGLAQHGAMAGQAAGPAGHVAAAHGDVGVRGLQVGVELLQHLGIVLAVAVHHPQHRAFGRAPAGDHRRAQAALPRAGAPALHWSGPPAPPARRRRCGRRPNRRPRSVRAAARPGPRRLRAARPRSPRIRRGCRSPRKAAAWPGERAPPSDPAARSQWARLPRPIPTREGSGGGRDRQSWDETVSAFARASHPLRRRS